LSIDAGLYHFSSLVGITSRLASWPQQARVLAGAGNEMAAVLPNSNQA